MSAKCREINEFYPLLMDVYSKDQTADKAEFKKFLSEHFMDADKIFTEFMGGNAVVPHIPEYTIEAYSSRTGEQQKEINHVQEAYKESRMEYEKMKDDFTKKIISLSIYDLSKNQIVSWDTPVGDTNMLNDNIFNYKVNLIRNIARFINTEVNIENKTEDEIEVEFNRILDQFANIINSDISKDENYHKVYNDYQVLKFFDDLIDRYCRFIRVKPEFVKSSKYSKHRYTYNGPNVKHFTGVFGKDEHYDISDAYSDLTKILLNFFPEVDNNGKLIEFTSIGETAFKSIGYKVSQWAKTTDDIDVRNELDKDINADWNLIIEKYKQALARNTVREDLKVRSMYKLNAIQKFLVGNEVNKDIRNMFVHNVFKTVLSSYVQYTRGEGENEKIKSVNLTERPLRIQDEFINNIIEAATVYWKDNISQFNKLLKKYNIKINGNNISINGINVVISNSTGKVAIDSDVLNISDIMSEFASIYITDNFETVAEFFNKKSKNGSNRNLELTTRLYVPVLAIILNNVRYNKTNEIEYGQKRDLSRVLSAINGNDVSSVIKNSDGNNLPLYQMMCLAYRHLDVHKKLSKEAEENEKYGIDSIHKHNVVYNNISHIMTPQIRSEINIMGKTVQSADMNADDVLHVSMGYDFFINLVSDQSKNEGQKKSGIVGFQPHVYSDKNKHFIMQFDLNKTWYFSNGVQLNLYEELNRYIQSGKVKDLSNIMDVYFTSNQGKYNRAVQNILNDYNRVFDIELKSLGDLKEFLKGKNIGDIRIAFFNQGVDFVEDIHASKIDGVYTVNETLEYLYNIFNDRNKFNDFINTQFEKFISEFSGSWNTLKNDSTLIYYFNKYNPRFVDGKSLKLIDNGDYNPMVYSYFIMDSFLSNEYNDMMVGNVYNHKNGVKLKNVENDVAKSHGWNPKKLSENERETVKQESKSVFLTQSLAARWIAQVKRMVIYGATYHPYAIGLKKGVPSSIKMAVIDDIGSKVWNMIGQNDSVDSMDGAGLTSPLLSRMQNVSLIDAAVGDAKKTIYHDIGSTHGDSTLLKWAEYPITNSVRRNDGDVDMDYIYLKMHDLKFAKDVYIQYNNKFDNLYFRNKYTGKYYKILSININGANATREIVECDKNGHVISENIIVNSFDGRTTIASIDELFGGAWCMEYDPISWSLQYTEKQNDYVLDIVCEYNLKDYMIGWLVNKSACKVGAKNLNSVKAWFDDSQLMYSEMSSRFGGVQMDADHDLDEAEVTEASQMISALEQMGYTHQYAMDAYMEIGKYCYDSIQDINEVLQTEGKELLYKIFGKALIKSFASGDKDTYGLAQSFIKLAQEGLNNENIDFKIPFSSSSINGIFNAIVTSDLVKKAIRRHYNGIPAVLNPSYNMVQIYNIGGHNYKYEELIDIVLNRSQETGIKMDIYSAMHKVFIDGKLNPFLEEIDPLNPVDIEDTIVIFNVNENNEVSNYEVVKIDSYEKYDFYRRYNSKPVFRWTIKPKNLKGSDTVFISNGVKYSAFESKANRILKYLINSKSGATNLNDFTYELHDHLIKELPTAEPENISVYVSEIIEDIRTELSSMMGSQVNLNFKYDTYLNTFKKRLVKKQQKLLKKISEKGSINWRGEDITIDSFEVVPAQIIMGKLNAKEFGLRKGDSIATIKEQKSLFFIDRLKANHKSDISNPNIYDWLLTDGSGRKLYVKLKDKTSDVLQKYLISESGYQNIDGKIYVNGQELCSSNRKKFYTLKDGNDNYDIVIVDTVDDMKEIFNTNLFNNIQRNYQTRNYNFLISEQFGEGSIQIPVKSKNGNIIYKNISEFDSTDRLLETLKTNEQYSLERKINKLAQEKYESFEKSLKFIGTRIPCQSMQSFAPMEVIAFDDDNTNKVYIPTTISWLEGSDYDKLYVVLKPL